MHAQAKGLGPSSRSHVVQQTAAWTQKQGLVRMLQSCSHLTQKKGGPQLLTTRPHMLTQRAVKMPHSHGVTHWRHRERVPCGHQRGVSGGGSEAGCPGAPRCDDQFLAAAAAVDDGLCGAHEVCCMCLGAFWFSPSKFFLTACPPAYTPLCSRAASLQPRTSPQQERLLTCTGQDNLNARKEPRSWPRLQLGPAWAALAVRYDSCVAAS